MFSAILTADILKSTPLLIYVQFSQLLLLNGKLETISGRLIKVAAVAASGTAGTYQTNIELKNTDTYLVLIRQVNDNGALTVSPIIYGYYNPKYITSVNGKIAIILSGSYGFADVYKIV